MNLPYLRWARSAASVVSAAVLLAACGGGGGGGSPPPATVTIGGRITFDRIPLDATIGNGLNPATIVESPAREVTVQAIDAATNNTLATATTDNDGNYSVTVPSNRNLFIRARAEMVKTGAAPTWNFSVRNNTTQGTNDALYALDGTATSSGVANTMRNLNAPTGFVGNSYSGERAAAPFAILDTAFKAKQLILGAAPSTDFPELRLFWSPQNKTAPGCLDDGDIGTTSYVVRGPPPTDTDDCGQLITDGIYILGDFDIGADTDEFDESVIAHEFGHYVEDRFGRSDSIGGGHGSDIPLDPRVAFGEGWGNAFSGMVLGGPVYRDSFDGVQDDFGIDMETDGTAADGFTEGWFSEASVQEILWDAFDSTNEPGDTVMLGFAPIYAAITSAHVVDTDALTTIYPLIVALRAANPGSATGIDTLLDGENIFGTDDFGAAESNDGGDTQVLPVYRTIQLGTPATVCSRSPFGNDNANKLGNRVLLRFDNNTLRLVTITAAATTNGGGTIAATDPDIFVLQRGALTASGVAIGSTETISQISLAAGTYIIEVYDARLLQSQPPPGTSPRCMTVSIQGN